MALKDWKKIGAISKKSIVFNNLENGEKIHIFSPQGEKKYFIRRGFHFPQEVNSKSQALKFAKQYMRTH